MRKSVGRALGVAQATSRMARLGSAARGLGVKDEDKDAVPEESRARDAYLTALTSGRQRAANDHAAGERISMLQGSLAQLQSAQAHDRKLLLEVRAAVLELRAKGDGGGATAALAARRESLGGAAVAAAAVQAEVITLSRRLETKLDDFRGCVAQLQQLPPAQMLSDGLAAQKPPRRASDSQRRAGALGASPAFGKTCEHLLGAPHTSPILEAPGDEGMAC